MVLLPEILKHGNVAPTDSVVLIEEEKPDPISPPVELPPVPSDDPERRRREWERIRQQSDTILEHVRKTAEAEQKELLNQTEMQAQALREQAVNRGYEEGVKQKSHEIECALERLDMLMEALEQSFGQYLERYQEELTDLAVAIVRKLILKRLDRNEEELAELVMQAVSTVRNAPWIEVEISDELPGLKRYLDAELTGSGVEIKCKPVPADSCILHTPEGRIDASVGTQLENLRKALKAAPQNLRQAL